MDIKTDTINDWDSLEYKNIPPEMYYYSKKENCFKEDCNENSVGILLSLYNTLSNSTKPSNRKSFYYKLKLSKVFSLFINGLSNQNLNEDLSIKKPEKYFSVIRAFTSDILYLNKYITYYDDTNNFMSGKSDVDNNYINFLKLGNFYENFKPYLNGTTGMLFDDPNMINYYTMQTGYGDNESNLRRISEFNDFEILNIKSKIYSPSKNEYMIKNVPYFNNLNLRDYSISDGFQYYSNEKKLQYFDRFSSLILEFNYLEKREFHGKFCDWYALDKLSLINLKENTGSSIINNRTDLVSVYQKFNKPYVISKYSFFNKKNSPFTNLINFEPEFEKDEASYNSMCIDPYSDLVLFSNLTLVVILLYKATSILYLQETIII
jgi:hypothetical protein